MLILNLILFYIKDYKKGRNDNWSKSTNNYVIWQDRYDAPQTYYLMCNGYFGKEADPIYAELSSHSDISESRIELQNDGILVVHGYNEKTGRWNKISNLN
jgi:hypothetical protein